ncbi:MAG: acyl-CoA dehydrogenase [Saprospiraceae bacterium]|nr:acyl-CoA dehydrogenase [Saprospiraceae bacterium]
MNDIGNKVLKGGEFVIKETLWKDNFIPEDISDEQKLIRESVKNFVETEIKLHGGKLDQQERLLLEAANLGLLSSHVSSEYGGSELDTYTNTVILEEFGKGDASFNTSLAAHTGIGMLPIYYFASEEIKKKYLPGLCNGTLKASYCLTEPGSGSDALSAKTTATLNSAGTHYIISGQKMWISNAGFADVLIVFGQIDGDKFTGFLVERNSPGISMGEEEHKLGIKGSSTRQVFFENVAVPKENLLGELGKGHLIAFNVLNIGRFKLGCMAMGGCKSSIEAGIKYANQRIQFNQKISEFGAIQYKIAESIIRTYATESAVYRVSDLLEDKFKEELHTHSKAFLALQKAAEEYSIECAIIKVYGSDTLDYVVDELVQIHGGYGYSEEYIPSKLYRDARINRIYEGTNEINRLLIVNMLIRRTLKGLIDLVGPAWEVQKELTGLPDTSIPDEKFGLELRTLRDFKKMSLMVAGAAVKYQMDGKHDLKDQQEILMNIADMLIDLFVSESVLLRVQKLSSTANEIDLKEEIAILQVQFHDAQYRIAKAATDALASFASGDELKIMLLGIKRFSRYPVINVVKNRKIIAHKAIEENRYCY